MIESLDKLIISKVKTDMLKIVWPTVKDMLSAAADHSNGEICIYDLYNRIFEGEILLLTVYKNEELLAAITIEQRIFPTGKEVLMINTSGGHDMNLWLDEVLEKAEGLAVELNCEEVYIIGRAGWRKLLKSKGYGDIHSIIGKKVR